MIIAFAHGVLCTIQMAFFVAAIFCGAGTLESIRGAINGEYAVMTVLGCAGLMLICGGLSAVFGYAADKTV